MLLGKGNETKFTPPYAGITLARFYGYNLSPDPWIVTPRETLKTNFFKLSK